ncbi:hypothetical protein BDA96_06G279200 [Sorghum bicolor]|uniref:Uncharacterized protein n=2 Tax=Sorghum bicolor TaxID=4558 RepID=A0A921QWA0_SORBI|nr:hypothetical protein BDA96_06G279200 [Sorghum bicolor]KXG27360.1 hypothetical protein SORBI_3006G255700 [Sorghum bicolor]
MAMECLFLGSTRDRVASDRAGSRSFLKGRHRPDDKSRSWLSNGSTPSEVILSSPTQSYLENRLSSDVDRLIYGYY